MNKAKIALNSIHPKTKEKGISGQEEIYIVSDFDIDDADMIIPNEFSESKIFISPYFVSLIFSLII